MANAVYLDNSATTPLRPEILQEMLRVYQQVPGNPSSLHRLGLEAERELKSSRDRLARCLRVSEHEIIFTSGGTEANNLAIRGVTAAYRRQGRDEIITTRIEHPSVLNVCRDLEKQDLRVIYCPVDRHGLLKIDELVQTVSDRTLLVSVMLVNNEVGTIQPVYEIGHHLKKMEHPPFFHVDAVQAFGRFPIHPRLLGIDLLTFSAHKLGGPKGVGALYLRKGVRLCPLCSGGGQEMGLRPGTENVAGAVGMARAAELALTESTKTMEHFNQLRDYLRERLNELSFAVQINGARSSRQAPYIISLYIPGIQGEILVRYLEKENIFVSTQAACSSRRAKVSHVLRAIGMSDQASAETIRVSLGFQNSIEDLERFVSCLEHAVEEIGQLVRR